VEKEGLKLYEGLNEKCIDGNPMAVSLMSQLEAIAFRLQKQIWGSHELVL
jgi:hypothetical protein